MAELFLKIVNMSISATWLVLAVLILRFALKKAPKWVPVLLWGLVAFRLLCPVSLESALSLIPSSETIRPDIMLSPAPTINSGIPVINNSVNPILSQMFAPKPEASANPLQIWIPLAAALWLAGIALMTAYTAISYLRLRRRLKTAIPLRDNIFQSERVASPFVLGILRPRIYLPFSLNEQDMPHVIAHERAHIRRRDHWWKPLGFLLLTLHWFNPFLWLAYMLLCRDIELACDEAVIQELDADQRADYSQALLGCSVSRKAIAACPLAFGEVGVKARVKSVLNYKKPGFWILMTAALACTSIAIGFLTDPLAEKSIDDTLSAFLEREIAAHHHSAEHSGENFVCMDYQVLDLKKSGSETTVYLWVLYQEYSYDDGLREESGAHTPTVITAKKAGSDYALLEYWTPRSGTYYPKDIRAKFPLYLHGKALDSQRYIDKQRAACEQKAYAYFAEALPPAQEAQTRLALGTYIPVQCVYMSPASSYVAFHLSEDFRYTVTEDSFITDAFENDHSEIPVFWQWKHADELKNELDFLKNSFFYDYTLRKDFLYQRLHATDHIIKDGDRIYLVRSGDTRSDLTRIWSIYLLAPENE